MNNTLLISTCSVAMNNTGDIQNSKWGNVKTGFQIPLRMCHLRYSYYCTYTYTSVLLLHIGGANPFLRFCLSAGIELQCQAQCYVTTKRCKGNLHAVRAVRVACVDCEAHSDYYRG